MSGGNQKVYELVADRIIQRLETGSIPWEKPWNATGVPNQNFVTRRPYHGINVFLTAMQGFASPYWLTFKQAQDMGGSVKRGEKGTPVIYFRKLEVSEVNADGDAEEKWVPLLRYYTVFNVQQCSLPIAQAELIPRVAVREVPAIEAAERIVAAMPQRPEIVTGGDQAAYLPNADRLMMPERSAFNSAEGYYETLFHELTHSTGHASRVGREIKNGFGCASYAKEELVAEMGMSFLCAVAGIETEKTTDQAAAYIRGWLKALRNDKRMVISAAAQAQKAADFILGAKEETAAAEVNS